MLIHNYIYMHTYRHELGVCMHTCGRCMWISHYKHIEPNLTNGKRCHMRAISRQLLVQITLPLFINFYPFLGIVIQHVEPDVSLTLLAKTTTFKMKMSTFSFVRRNKQIIYKMAHFRWYLYQCVKNRKVFTSRNDINIGGKIRSD